MALTGQLSDMSLAELIEFFCNQRKTGRLKVDYHRGHGVFFIKEGELVDAKVGQLSGSEAVFFALTLPNAAFDFSPEVQPSRRTINEAWTQVVLEGLRRLDEGLSPTESDAFGGWTPTEADLALFMDQVDRLGDNGAKAKAADKSAEAVPFSMMTESASSEGNNKKKFMLIGAAACVVLAVGVAAIPLMSGSSKPAAATAPQAVVAQPDAPAKSSSDEANPQAASDAPVAPEASTVETDAAERERAARERERQRERERKAAEEAKKAEAAQDPNAATASSGPKSVRISVTYDDSGRVTATSVAGASPGAEAFAGTAARIARGKRFPAGKAGTTVVTIPVN